MEGRQRAKRVAGAQFQGALVDGGLPCEHVARKPRIGGTHTVKAQDTVARLGEGDGAGQRAGQTLGGGRRRRCVHPEGGGAGGQRTACDAVVTRLH